MIKSFLFSSLFLILLSCSNDTANESGQPTTHSSDHPIVQEGLSLVASNDCFSCHKVAEKMVGPSYKAIAEKYSNTDVNLKSLAQKIIKGGSGNWGSLPMNPHPNISKADAEKMSAYILSIK